MQRAEDSSDSSDTEVEEVETNEWWDNYQEDPSFLEVSVNSAKESEEAERRTRRQSSTRDNLLDNSPRQLIRPLSSIQIQIVPIQSGHQEGHPLSQSFSQNISYLVTCCE